jgi:hypothetical protein
VEKAREAAQPDSGERKIKISKEENKKRKGKEKTKMYVL